MTEKSKTRKGGGLILFALLLLANPNIHVIDVLPDFISYFIIVRALGYASDRAPYFAEARADFSRLCVLNIAKIPALMLLTLIRSGNVGDNDIVALIAFSFGVAEVVLLIGAIRNLFSAFFYLGERSAAALISPFAISKDGTRKTTPERLRTLCIAFSVYKCAAYSLPQLLLLSKTVSSGNAATFFNVAKLYPYTVVIVVPTVLVFGIVLASRFYKYIKAITAEGAFVSALDSMVDEAGRLEIAKKDKIRGIKHTLTVFIIAPIFCLEVRFDNFNAVNLLPRFIFGLLILYALFRLSKYVGDTKIAMGASVAYSVCAFLLSHFEIQFLNEYSYGDLVKNKFARSEYTSLIICSAIETVLFAALIIICAILVGKFVILHTGVDKESDKYMHTDADYHKKLTIKVVIWAIIGISSSVARLLNVIFRYHSKNIQVSVENGDYITSEVVTQSAVPWFGMAVFAAAVLFIGYSIYLFNILRDDAELKYQ